MDYIYSQLNHSINAYLEQQTLKIKPNEQIYAVKDKTNNSFDFFIETEKLVKLLPVQDGNTDNVQKFQLYGYNRQTKTFNLPIGEPIVIQQSAGATSITSIKFKDESNNVIAPECEIDQTGALTLKYVPISAISNKYTVVDSETGESKQVETEVIIDGNDF